MMYSANILNLIQSHTRIIYNLDNKKYVIKNVPARTLLTCKRFDLYAKIFYIKYKKTDLLLATKVYTEHIKAFNPNFKEPGRNDKSGIDNFICTFNKLINDFAVSEMDSTISIVPVDKNGIILDGAHRVATLAYYDKKVSIIQFEEIQSKAVFDYNYFLGRGLKREIADIIASEALNWCNHIYSVVLLKKNTCLEEQAWLQLFNQCQSRVIYQKDIFVTSKNIESLRHMLVSNVSNNEECRISCSVQKMEYSFPLYRRMEIVFIESKDKNTEDLIGKFKSILFIFSNISNKTIFQIVSDTILDKTNKIHWLQDWKIINLNRFYDFIKDSTLLFRFKYYLKFKVFLYRIIHGTLFNH